MKTTPGNGFLLVAILRHILAAKLIGCLSSWSLTTCLCLCLKKLLVSVVPQGQAYSCVTISPFVIWFAGETRIDIKGSYEKEWEGWPVISAPLSYHLPSLLCHSTGGSTYIPLYWSWGTSCTLIWTYCGHISKTEILQTSWVRNSNMPTTAGVVLCGSVSLFLYAIFTGSPIGCQPPLWKQ